MSQVLDILDQPVSPGDMCAFTWTDGELKVGEFLRAEPFIHYGSIRYNFKFKTVQNKGTWTGSTTVYTLEDVEAGHKSRDLKSSKMLKIDPQTMPQYIKAYAR
jgi:hypothetical protein